MTAGFVIIGPSGRVLIDGGELDDPRGALQYSMDEMRQALHMLDFARAHLAAAIQHGNTAAINRPAHGCALEFTEQLWDALLAEQWISEGGTKPTWFESEDTGTLRPGWLLPEVNTS